MAYSYRIGLPPWKAVGLCAAFVVDGGGGGVLLLLSVSVTIGNLLQDRVEQHPDRDAVVFHQDSERLSFQQLLTQVRLYM